MFFLKKDNSPENCLFSRFDFCADFSVSRGNINISETTQKFQFFLLRFNRSKQVIPFPPISHKFLFVSPVQINRNDFDLLNQGGETNDFVLIKINVFLIC